jgi:hypothetical protein
MAPRIFAVKRLLLLIFVAGLALAGCGGGSDTESAPTGRTPAPAHHPNINALGVSEPESRAQSCPHEGKQVQRAIAKLKRLVRQRRLPSQSEEITVSCPPRPGNPGGDAGRQRGR